MPLTNIPLPFDFWNFYHFIALSFDPRVGLLYFSLNSGCFLYFFLLLCGGVAGVVISDVDVTVAVDCLVANIVSVTVVCIFLVLLPGACSQLVLLS